MGAGRRAEHRQSGSLAPSTAAAEIAASSIRAVQIAPDGDRIYLLELAPGQPQKLHVWSILNSFVAQAVAQELKWSVPLAEGAISIALRGDGKLLAVGDRSGAVTLIDASTRALVARIPAPQRGFGNLLARPGILARRTKSGRRLADGHHRRSGRSPTPDILGCGFTFPATAARSPILAFDHPRPPDSPARAPIPLVEVWDLDVIDGELVRLGLAD